MAGVLFFPNMSETDESGMPRDISDCVDVGASVAPTQLGPATSAQRERFQNALTDARVGGGSPTHDAYMVAMEQLGNAPSPRKALVLVSDGNPNYARGCVGTGSPDDIVDPGPFLDDIELARSKGVLTYVIGTAGSEAEPQTGADARPFLSKAAAAGGTARPACSDAGPSFCHRDLTSGGMYAESLAQEIAAIVCEVRACACSNTP